MFRPAFISKKRPGNTELLAMRQCSALLLRGHALSLLLDSAYLVLVIWFVVSILTAAALQLTYNKADHQLL